MPVANVVLIEIGLALGFLLILISPGLWPVAATVAGALLLWAIARYRGRWLTHWMGLVLSYRGRNHVRFSEPPQSGAGQPEGANLQTSVGSRRDDRSRDDEESAGDADERNGNQRDSGDDEKSLRFIGPENHRVSLLRLTVPDLVVGSRQDHNRNQVGIAWHDGKWTAVLAVEPTPGLISEMNRTPNLPLGALAPCLEDRGVVLDSIQVLWHCYPGSAALPVESPALNSYLEVLGPLPAAARRTTWVVVRIDPRYCAKAVGERGGGIVGAHRALIGALSRVRSALERQGIVTRPLDPEGLLQAGVSSAELHGVLGSNEPVGLQERWNSVTMGYIGHSSYAITSWPSHMTHTLNALTGVRALSSSIALTISPVGEENEVGLRGLVRVSARTPSELSAADTRMRRISSRLGLTLTPLGGLQLEGFTSTLPIGGAA